MVLMFQIKSKNKNMKKILLVLMSFICFGGFAQKFTTADEVIEKYLEVTKIKANAAVVTDMVMNMTSESPRGVAETEVKFAFPFKYTINVYASGMTLMSTIYDGERLLSKSNWGGGNQEPKTGAIAKNEANKTHPFIELEYKNIGFTSLLLPDDGEHYVVEFKDPDGKTWKSFYNMKTGLKDKTWFKTESPRGPIESTTILESYKAFKGSEILFPSVRKQTTPMGEISSEVQSIKFNKGVKPKDFEIK
jgi:outer membrane lipoprotein-sorting protein